MKAVVGIQNFCFLTIIKGITPLSIRKDLWVKFNKRNF